MPATVERRAAPDGGTAAGMDSLGYRGHRLRFVDRGSGEPIVFVHNGGISHRVWDYQLSHFDRSHRVIAPDLLGYGESDRPQMRYSVEDYVTQLEQLVDQLRIERFDLVGFCLGGGVALEFARRFPQRVRSLTAIAPATPKAIASGPLGAVEAVSSPGSPLRNALWRFLETRPGRWVASQILSRLQGSERALADPSFREHVGRMYAQEGQWRVFCNTDYSGLATVEAGIDADRLPPTMLMWGNDNRVLRPSAGEELASAIRAERKEFWDGCSYMLMRERPEQTNRVIHEFIESNGV